MALTLAQFKAPEARPKLFTFCAEGGLGKTSLACLFPSPIVIRCEDGLTEDMTHVMATPLLTSSGQLFEVFNALASEPHDRKTLVIDSVTQLNTLIEAETVAGDENNPQSINQALGGYGAGHSAVSEVHRQIRDWASYFVSMGMHIVFIAHADSEQIDPPDGDAFTRYTLRMNKRSVSHYTDNVDVVGFIKLQKLLKTGRAKNGPKKAISDGSRIITCYPSAAHLSKNRLGIKADLPFEEGVNPFAPCLGNHAAPQPVAIEPTRENETPTTEPQE